MIALTVDTKIANEQSLALLGDLKNVSPEPLLMYKIR
jgi:hypothetical protein